ncbi:MAG: hypothetical protein AAF657_01865 [Acidobacteriota bacterium]
MSLSRRRFLRGVGQAGFTAWLGAEFALDAMAAPASAQETQDATGTERGILKVRLLASRLDEMADFYAVKMGWPVSRVGSSLRVRTGGTEMRFDAAPEGAAPFYHVAWAIPSNKFDIGKAWLYQRAPLLKNSKGHDEFHFKKANRRAVYFKDPAGNILELIARDDLGDVVEGPFSLRDVLYVNHVGLVIDNMDETIVALNDSLGLLPTAPPEPNVTKMGDKYRHITLVTKNRLWIPEMEQGAKVFTTEVVMHGPKRAVYDPPNLPYRISTAS